MADRGNQLRFLGLKKRDRCGLRIPTLIVGSDNYEAAQHIREAQTGLLAGRGFFLRYRNRPRTGFQRGKCGLVTPPGNDCDEYPFFRTVQGGPVRWYELKTQVTDRL